MISKKVLFGKQKENLCFSAPDTSRPHLFYNTSEETSRPAPHLSMPGHTSSWLPSLPACRRFPQTSLSFLFTYVTLRRQVKTEVNRVREDTLFESNIMKGCRIQQYIYLFLTLNYGFEPSGGKQMICLTDDFNKDV